MEKAYMAYVTDSLQGIPQGKYLQSRFSDMAKPRQEIDVQAVIDRVATALEEQ